PQAATPKTANLTRIRYAEKPVFVAHFYSPQAWASLEALAASPAQDLTSSAARELVQAAQRMHGDGVAKLLAQERVEIHVDDLAGLMGHIDDYVGAEGRFTPLVESSELFLPLPELAGIEIVDTPGMNDPVVSRTDKTREYMAQCDVVFFLSPAPRFLDESDQQLLA
ncbi:MAG: dynamin family protein, partial [Burkholderiales bacterium]|nr:dynamin family protein [Burkholderiales bacterium]